MDERQTERRERRWLRGPRAHVVLLLLGASLLSSGPAAAAVKATDIATTADPVIAAAGDIACDPANANYNNGLGTSGACRQKYTSDLLVNGGYAAVLPLGDVQYECGSLAAFQASYDSSWGRVKAITHPAIGNHEYITSAGLDTTGCNASNTNAAGYFNYFGPAGAGVTGKGYYSYDIGSWHIIALNSQCGPGGGCSVGTQQETWLRNDLATHSNFCTLAYWHVPLYSSGGRAATTAQTFWQDLYNANADVVLNGHDHIYERFAPQNAAGALDNTRGIREFIAGTGGNNHTSITTVAANSEVRDTTTFGVLQLTLHATSYDWKFVPAVGNGTFTDSGTTACHGTQADTQAPTAPANLTATAASASELDLAWTASTDNTGVTGYRIFRDGIQLTTVAGTSYADTNLVPSTTHSYQVYAVDASGNVSPASNTAQATTLADTSPPTAPSGLSASPASSTEIDLSWTASTDNVAVDHYAISRNGTQVAISPGTTFADTGLTPSTAYSYSVTAVDVAGNVSPAATASATTPAPPTTLTFTAAADTYAQQNTATTNYGTSTQLVVDGSPVTNTFLKFDVSGINGRQVLSAKLRLFCSNDASQFGGEYHKVADSSWSETAVTWNNQPAIAPAVLGTIGSTATNTWFEVDVTPAVTGDGLLSLAGVSTNADGVHYASREAGAATAPQLVVTTSAAPADTTPPTQPGSFGVAGTTDTSVSLSWTASSDNVGVDHYELSRNGTLIASPTGTSYTDTGRTPSTLYSYSLVAVDAAGNRSTAATVNATTAPDTTAPAPPTTLNATTVTASQVDLAWSGATDNVAVTGYRIYRNGVQIGSAAGTTFTDTTVTPSTSYGYTVTALDAAGNESAQSAALPVTTPAAGATLFSDGFESGALGAWTNVTGLTVQQALVFNGAWAARMTSTGTATYAYGKLSSTATTVTYSFQFLIASQGANNVNLLRIRTAAGGSLGAVYVTSTDRLALRNDIANVSTTSATTVSQGVWHALTVQFVVGDLGGSSQSVSLDGAPVATLSRTDTLGTTPVGIVQLGEATTARTYDIAYDDVRVTTP